MGSLFKAPGHKENVEEIKAALKENGFKQPGFSWINPRSGIILARK